MDEPFDLDVEQRHLQRSTREIAHDVLRGVEQDPRDGSGPLPHDRFIATRPAYRRLVEAGCLHAVLPHEVGGSMRGAMDLAVIAEELTTVNPDVALTLFATTLGLGPLVQFGTEQQREHLAPFLTRAGSPLAAFALTEPGGSANFAAPAPAEGTRTTAVRAPSTPPGGDRHPPWIINGTKKWVSNAGGWQGVGPDLMCVVARTDPTAEPRRGLSVLVLTGPIDGLTVVDTPDTIGYRSHSTPTIALTDARAAPDAVIGAAGDGVQIVAATFTPANVQVAVFGLALMRAAFDFALRFARTERRGGPFPIIEHDLVGHALISARIRIDAVRALTWHACRALDHRSPTAPELALEAKIFGSDSAVAVITDLMRIVGVDSYSHAGPLGQLLQDALALPLFGGGNVVKMRQLHQLLRSE